ncbi:DUF3606 domain-containing protein [Ramlibacter tataouinensis]|uniref:DUF3606 domain-containing protein n=1 Tax=Ramlibacter tataouinensis (strain ATCC BAA-407 / DSM 14655 / LMG 21543 / TTB310) TaxID=365046 RepID=F5Y6I8_RAMTT|nr:DUF3606 domain-containing protein [Ramlibacter tataouinensis]AEG94062.1 hypothetical protein Rta_29590 [Ramlibacter tataouinensis TTB310]
MSDDVTNLARRDSQRIPLDDEQEVQSWARRLNTSPERLRQAVQAVGNQVHEVRVHLGQTSPTGDLPKAAQGTAD